MTKCGTGCKGGLTVGDTVTFDRSVGVVIKLVESEETHCLFKVKVPSAVIYVGSERPYVTITDIKRLVPKRNKIENILQSKDVHPQWYFKGGILAEKMIEAAGA